MSDIIEITKEIKSWADSIYPDRTPSSAFMKLFSEIGELVDSPHDPLEYADVFIILFDLADMHNINVLEAINNKLSINRHRNWYVNELGVLQGSSVDANNLLNADEMVAYSYGISDYFGGLPLDHTKYPESLINQAIYEKGYYDGQGGSHD